MPLISFYIPYKYQKTRGYLVFAVGMERDRRHEMGESKHILVKVKACFTLREKSPYS